MKIVRADLHARMGQRCEPHGLHMDHIILILQRTFDEKKLASAAPPFPRCNRESCRHFRFPSMRGLFLPRSARPRRAHRRTAIRKTTKILFSSERPRFRQRAWQRRKNPSRVSAALR